MSRRHPSTLIDEGDASKMSRRQNVKYVLNPYTSVSLSAGKQSLLPIWHDLNHADVAAKRPSLADRLARSTADTEIQAIADEIAELVTAAR